MREKSGFTVVDLLVVLVLVVVCSAIAATTLPTTRQASLAAHCRDNLKTINTGIALYGTENCDMAPILPDLDSKKPLNYRQDLSMGPDCLAKYLGEGAQQNLCLLVKQGSVGWRQFMCPAVGDDVDVRGDSQKYGFGQSRTGWLMIHYAIQVPYANTCDGKNACPLSANMHPKAAVMADGGPQMNFATWWSPNHRGTPGENVLYGDGHVQWYGEGQGKPNAIGYDGNNIYTADKWERKDGNPALVSNGTENRTPTDADGIFDSVLYAH